MVAGYDEALSHLMQGGCDAILILRASSPAASRSSMGSAMAASPWSRAPAGADTIIDANEAAVAAGVATGFQFAPDSADALLHAVRKAVALHADPAAWTAMQRMGMKMDVSWNRSADRYVQLYRHLLTRKAAAP